MSLSVVSLRFLHVVTGLRIPFFFEAEQYSTVRMDHIHLSVDTWATRVNSEALNMGAKVIHLEEVEIEEQP